jgi:hypothetical protein
VIEAMIQGEMAVKMEVAALRSKEGFLAWRIGTPSNVPRML